MWLPFDCFGMCLDKSIKSENSSDSLFCPQGVNIDESTYTKFIYIQDIGYL